MLSRAISARSCTGRSVFASSGGRFGSRSTSAPRISSRRRRLHELQELERLAPEIVVTAPFNVFDPTCAPVRDGGENSALWRWRIHFPKVCNNRLPRRLPCETMQRDRKCIGSNAFTKSKKCVVFSEIIDGYSVIFVDLDLLHTGIALDINNAFTPEQVVVELLRNWVASFARVFTAYE